MEDLSFKGKDAQFIRGIQRKQRDKIEARPLDATRIPADCEPVAISIEVSPSRGCHR